MLQALLAERLQVTVHREPRTQAFAALVASRGGPKLTPAPSAAVGQVTSRAGHIVGQEMTMTVLASLLSRFERQLIVDKSGLTGRYRFTLDWMPEDTAGAPGAAGGLSLNDALERQLGLRLEARREPLDVIVVDRAERVPADN